MSVVMATGHGTAGHCREPLRAATKLSYKLKLELDALPEKIEALEQQVAALEARTAAPDFYTQPFEEVAPVLDQLETARTALERAIERWMELEEQNHAPDRGRRYNRSPQNLNH